MDLLPNLPPNLPPPELSTPEQRKAAFMRAMGELHKHQKAIVGLTNHVRLLQTLAKGTMKERMLVALQNAGPLYQTLCPRKYRDIPTHASPRNLLIMCVLAALVFRDYGAVNGFDLKNMRPEQYADLMKRSDSMSHGYAKENSLRLWRVMGDMIENDSPTYYLDQEASEEMLETQCDDLKMTWDDFDWPHPVFMLMPPIGLYKNSPLLILAHRDDQYVTFTGLTEEMVDYNQKLFATEFPIKSEIGASVKSLMDAKYHRLIGGDKIRDMEDGLRDFINKTMQVCVNALLAMVAEPKFEELEKSGAQPRPASQERRARDPSALWNPTFFKMERTRQASEGSSDGKGGHRRPHPRRAHWKSVWLDGSEDTQLEPGKRARHTQDQRVAHWVTSIEGDVVTLKNAAGEEKSVHRSEVKPSKVKFRWIKRRIVGLKNHLA